jgi:transposase
LEPLPAAMSLLRDAAYDSRTFRQFLTGRGTTPVIKQNPTRKDVDPFDKDAYKARNVMEQAFSRGKDCRRVAKRHDKLARNFDAAVVLASTVTW